MTIEEHGLLTTPFFTGVEVEHTAFHGLRTLFVTGRQSVEDLASKLTRDIQHAYFGAGGSRVCNVAPVFWALNKDLKATVELLDINILRSNLFRDSPNLAVIVPLLSATLNEASVLLDYYRQHSFQSHWYVKLETPSGVWLGLVDAFRVNSWDDYKGDQEA